MLQGYVGVFVDIFFTGPKTLPRSLTARPLTKNDGWKTIRLPIGMIYIYTHIFKVYVSFREGELPILRG